MTDRVLAKLVEVTSPRNPEAVVLVLHGGASRGDVVHVSPAQLSVLRMIPTARRTARAGRGARHHRLAQLSTERRRSDGSLRGATRRSMAPRLT